MSQLNVIAPAKVNLTLHVGPVNTAGRHPLDSLVVFADANAADRLIVEPDDKISLAVIGPNADVSGPIEDNLVWRSADALRRVLETKQGARITLVKHLPVAGGIGGGSADAGAALRALNQLWGGPDSTTHLVALAAKLGGDVPVAVGSTTQLMRGEGERLKRWKLPDTLPAILVNPGLSCPTGPVFRRYDESGGGAGFVETDPPSMTTRSDIFDWLETTFNDLEAPAMSLVPEIAGVLRELTSLSGQRLVRMSGSGATCFALFDTMDAAAAAEGTLKTAHPDWWVRATCLGAAG